VLNRDRLENGDIFQKFMTRLLNHPQVKPAGLQLYGPQCPEMVPAALCAASRHDPEMVPPR
jgi:hypothetical protein